MEQITFFSAPTSVKPPNINVHDNNTVAVKFEAPHDPEDPSKPIKVRISISKLFEQRFISKFIYY